MKFNKISKKLAACSLAGVMMVSMMGMSVCAAGGVTGGTEDSPITSVPVNKTVFAAENTYAPNTTFNFTVSTGDTNPSNWDGKEVKQGILGGLKVKQGATFAPDTTASTKTTYSTIVGKDATKFNVPGIYHYVVSENNDGRYEGITYDTTIYDVYVYVSAKLDANKNATNDMYVSGVVSAKSVDGEIAKSDLEFNNVYNGVHKVTVTKKVQGGFATAGDTFKFNVTVNGATGEVYKVAYTTKNKPETTTVASGATIEVELGKDDTVTIYGLSATDSYTISEQGITDGKTTTGYTVADNCGESDGIVSGKGGNEDANYIITNTKEAVAPTGIAMTVAPYILMVVVAGIFAVLFLRRRHEEA